MPARIDHVIIAASDLTQLEETFTRLGFSVVGGGVHPHLGTRNRIIVLGDGYIELLALADAARASAALRERIARGGGWVGYALQSDDIEAEAEAMRERGVDAHGPARGALVAPSGVTRGWRVVTVGVDDLWAAAYPLPFLIQHDSSGEQHRRELAGADDLTPHLNGATHLVGVTLRTTDLSALRERYERVYGLTSAPGDTPAPANADDQSAMYPLGTSGESIKLTQSTNAHTVMSVQVAVAVQSLLNQAIRQTGFAAISLPDALSVTLPGVSAELQFTSHATR